MKPVRLAVAGLVVTAALAVSAAIGAPPASAATCQHRDTGWVDSGVSYASVYLYMCYEGNSSWWEFRGTLYDDACDNRTAYLDIYPWEGGHYGIHAPGCGNRTPFTIKSNGLIIPAALMDIRTRACNTWGCSSSDWDTLDPYP